MTNIFLVAGIFLLAFVILFAVTKDRWNWMKIFKRTLIWGIGGIAVTLGALYTYSNISNLPKKTTEYMGIKLTDTMDDVKFKKGTETISIDKNTNTQVWTYKFPNNFAGEVDPQYGIYWRGNKIRLIFCMTPQTQKYYCENVNGISIGGNSHNIFEKIGKNYESSVNKEKTERIYSYREYNNHFMLEKDMITALGIYNPDFGNVKFNNSTSILKPKK